MSPVDTAAAQERLNAAGRIYSEALAEMTNACAEMARLSFLASVEADEEPVSGFRFSTEYCYDDEGSYFESLSVALLDAEGEDIDYDDELESFGPEAIRLLCGAVEGADAGGITVAEARERSF